MQSVWQEEAVYTTCKVIGMKWELNPQPTTRHKVSTLPMSHLSSLLITTKWRLNN